MVELQEKIDFLLEKYNVKKNVILIDKKNVIINGENVSLLPWRNERRFVELKNMVNDGTLMGISTMRVCRIEKKGTDLNSIIYRELDLCEWIIGSEFIEIMAFKNNNTANIIAKMNNDIICTIEVAATLSADAQPIDKHEIIAQRGIACDRVVDTQVPQQSIYVYTDSENPETYLDVDFELFGLSIEETALVRQVFDVTKNNILAREINASAKRLDKLVALSDKSAAEVCNMKVEG